MDAHAYQRLRSTASVVAAVALAVFAATRFFYANIIWNPGYYGTFGLTANPWANFTVRRVVPGSPADQAGIQVGDRIEQPRALHDRLVLYRIAPRSGERITLSVLRGGHSRTVTLQARPLAPQPVTDRILLAAHFTWFLVFVAVSFVLVLLRPSVMTWGFFLFPLNLTIIFSQSDLFFSYIPTNWFLAMRIAEAVIASAGLIGFFIFGIRFPANDPTGWRRTVENLAPFLFVALATTTAYWELLNILVRPAAIVPYALDAFAIAVFVAGIVALSPRYSRVNDSERREIAWVTLGLICGVVFAIVGLLKQVVEIGPEQHWTAHATLLLGTIALLMTYVGAHGLERQRIKWVVLGVICAWIADGANHIGLSLDPFYNTKWFIGIFEPLYLALPLAVAYAVIRHRVIDIRFVLSRSLTFVFIGSAVALIVVAIAWLFSTRLPNSHWEAAAYAGVALLVGFSLNAARQSVGRTIDFLFFREWHQTQRQAEAIGDTIRRASSLDDLYEPLTAGIANAFSLASVALFERVEGGGFVRVSALGWPPGTLWHILADDQLVQSASENRRAVGIEDFQWRDLDLPTGVARPTTLFPVAAGKRVFAVLLCGAHDNGTGLAPDEIRAIRSLCANAGVVYNTLSTAESQRSAYLDQQIKPLRA
jgi:hypothetical protein